MFQRRARMVRPWYDYRWAKKNSMRGVDWTGIEARYIPSPPLARMVSKRGMVHYVTVEIE